MVDRNAPLLDEAVLAGLVKSLGDVGLINPITIWSPNGANVEVLAGRHRLEAAKRLGWETIDCIEMPWTSAQAADAELVEIAENIHRRELSREEKDRLLVRYAERMKERDEKKAGQGVPLSVGGRGNVGLATQVAEELGVTKRTVNRALARERERENPKPPKPVPLASDPLNDFEAKEKWMSSMMSLWNRGSKEWREEFMERVDGVVFDAAADA